jgi:hypothetical protein
MSWETSPLSERINHTETKNRPPKLKGPF